jgi:hypothetical protein
MSHTRLMAVERNGYWTVRVTWPNGVRLYFGEFLSMREARQLMKQHSRLKAKGNKSSPTEPPRAAIGDLVSRQAPTLPAGIDRIRAVLPKGRKRKAKNDRADHRNVA